jgi:hypothetical protein
VAVRVRLPVSVKTIWQLPEPLLNVPLHVSEPPLTVTVTEPVGAPLPGATAATLKLTVTACPITEESGRSEVIVVVVSALLTPCASVSLLA